MDILYIFSYTVTAKRENQIFVCLGIDLQTCSFHRPRELRQKSQCWGFGWIEPLKCVVKGQLLFQQKKKIWLAGHLKLSLLQISSIKPQRQQQSRGKQQQLTCFALTQRLLVSEKKKSAINKH